MTKNLKIATLLLVARDRAADAGIPPMPNDLYDDDFDVAMDNLSKWIAEHKADGKVIEISEGEKAMRILDFTDPDNQPYDQLYTALESVAASYPVRCDDTPELIKLRTEFAVLTGVTGLSGTTNAANEEDRKIWQAMKALGYDKQSEQTYEPSMGWMINFERDGISGDIIHNPMTGHDCTLAAIAYYQAALSAIRNWQTAQS